MPVLLGKICQERNQNTTRNKLFCLWASVSGLPVCLHKIGTPPLWKVLGVNNLYLCNFLIDGFLSSKNSRAMVGHRKALEHCMLMYFIFAITQSSFCSLPKMSFITYILLNLFCPKFALFFSSGYKMVSTFLGC